MGMARAGHYKRGGEGKEGEHGETRDEGTLGKMDDNEYALDKQPAMFIGVAGIGRLLGQPLTLALRLGQLRRAFGELTLRLLEPVPQSLPTRRGRDAE